jgi:hypothetical protein
VRPNLTRSLDPRIRHKSPFCSLSTCYLAVAEAVLDAARRLGLARLLDREPSRERDLCVAMIAGRVLEPGSKLACTRQLDACTLGEELGVQGAVHDDLYAAMGWLLERQPAIEQRLARRHLTDG